MKKFIKFSLLSVVAIMTVIVASSSISALAENSVVIESVDGAPLGISVASFQVKALYGLIPENYKKMLDASYGTFRTKTLAAGYGKTIVVDGIKMSCRQDADGDVYTLSASFKEFGFHKIEVKVGSRDAFIEWMDGMIL